MDRNSLVSVIIPTYNRALALKDAIQSAMNQTWAMKEIIVVDDGSTDETYDVVATFGGRVRYIYQKNEGASGARNTGIKYSNGKYITFLDSDDLWDSQKLQVQVEDMENNPSCSLHLTNARVSRDHMGTFELFQKCKFLRSEATILKRPLKEILRYDMARLQCCMIREEALNFRNNVFRPNLPIYEDLDFFLRFALVGNWYINTSPLVRILRREEKIENLSALRTKQPIQNMIYLTDIFKKLLDETRMRHDERNAVSRCFGGLLRQFAYVLLYYSRTKDGYYQLKRSLKYDLKLRTILVIFVILLKPSLGKTIAARRL